LEKENASLARIIGIEGAVPPPNSADETPARRVSPLPVDLVLELPSGSTNELGLKVGQTVQMGNIR
jgi:uncharacterized membrane protein (UPF0127 family)